MTRVADVARAMAVVVEEAMRLTASEDRPGQDGHPCVFCGYKDGNHNPSRCGWYRLTGACGELAELLGDDEG